MEVPGDVLYGDVLVKLSGNREAVIENYKGILLYTEEVTGTISTITYISNGDLCC